MATHVKELIAQNYERMLDLWPMAPVGLYSAGLKKYEAHMPIVFGGIASMVGNGSKFGHVSFLVIDEAHLLSPKESTMYQKFIKELMVINPKLRVVGFTATPYRQGQGMLWEGEGAIFTGLVYDGTSFKAWKWFLEQGYLAYLRPFKTDAEMSDEGIGIVAGEYNKKQAQDKANDEKVTRDCVRELCTKAADRNHWLIFATGVDHAKIICDMLTNEFGVSATCVHSPSTRHPMTEDERDRRIADYKAGKYRVMVNNGILTTGFDFPALDCIAVMRLTNSTSLWVQMLGRGTRPFYADGFDLSTVEGRLAAIAASDKPYCLVLDFANNAYRLGPINDPRLPKPKGKTRPGDVPLKVCGQCGMQNHASVRVCGGCGADFFIPLKLKRMAGDAELIKEDEAIKVEVFKVDYVTYALHTKSATNSTSIRVSYHTKGFKLFEEWINVEQANNGRAKRWWKQRGGDIVDNFPSSTLRALEMVESLDKPSAIHVNLTNKYPEIINYEFDSSRPKETATPA